MSSFDLRPRATRSTGLSVADYIDAARALGLKKVSTIRAVSSVESAGGGFLPSGRPKILFEGHIFYDRLKKIGKAGAARKIDASVCYPAWTKRFYRGGDEEYSRLEKAIAICEQLSVPVSHALASASWQRFQICGFNYKECGYASIEDYVEAMFKSEDAALDAFVAYVKAVHLDDEMRASEKSDSPARFDAFARGYNGPLYKRNNYGLKMHNAEVSFRKYNLADLSPVQNINLAMPAEKHPSCDNCRNTSLDDRYNDFPAVTESASEKESSSKKEPPPPDPPNNSTADNDSSQLPGNTPADKNDPQNSENDDSENASPRGKLATKAAETLSRAGSAVNAALEKLSALKEKVDSFGFSASEGFHQFFISFFKTAFSRIWNLVTLVFITLIGIPPAYYLAALSFLLLLLLAYYVFFKKHSAFDFLFHTGIAGAAAAV